MDEPRTGKRADMDLSCDLLLDTNLPPSWGAILLAMSPSSDMLRAALPVLRKELAEMEQQIDRHRNLIALIEAEQAAAIAIPSTSSNGASDEKPQGTGAAVMQILSQSGKRMRARDILKEMERRDWVSDAQDPYAAVVSALHYLAKGGRVEKTGSRTTRSWKVAVAAE